MPDRRAEIIDKLRQSGTLSADALESCSEEEIRQLESQWGRPLPAAYRQFLELMGRGAGPLMEDVEIFFPAMVKGRDEATEILQDYDMELPENAYVFASRLGEQFFFFEADGEDPDPPVYSWSEGAEEFTRAFESIWDFVEAEISIFD